MRNYFWRSVEGNGKGRILLTEGEGETGR